MSNVSEALDTIIEATKYAEDTGNQDLADSLGNAYQVLGNRVISDVMPSDAQHNINESYDKLRLETDLTRGTGTRDQEKHKLKARGETPEEAAENLSEAVEELEARNVFERTRAIENDE